MPTPTTSRPSARRSSSRPPWSPRSRSARFAGRLGITALNPGQYVNAGDKLVTLQTLDPIYVDFTLPQQQLAGLAVGQVVNLSVDTFPGQSFSGKINAISPKVDAATRNVQIEATIANPKQVLLPGMFANVKIDIGGTQERLTLPSTAVTYNPYGSTVYVVKPAEPPKAGAPATPGAPAPRPPPMPRASRSSWPSRSSSRPARRAATRSPSSRAWKPARWW